MRSAREALGFTHLEMDERIGLGSGHYGKIERMGASWGKEAFKLTQSVTNALDLLGLELLVAPKGEFPAETCPRDVRLPAPSNVIALPQRSMSASPGLVAQWRRAKLEAAQREARTQAKKKPAVREAQRA
jgi:hypothetical protein